MTEPILVRARRSLHQELAAGLWCIPGNIPSNADRASKTSVRIGLALAKRVGVTSKRKRLGGSAAGSEFERRVSDFLSATFPHLHSVRPGAWEIRTGGGIAQFEQYAHLDVLSSAAACDPDLAVVLGNDYTIKPDIVVTRAPEPDARLDAGGAFVSLDTGQLSPFRAANNDAPLLHASISCKWTIRSDRSQNSRAEALNLLRNRKGRAPHVAVVTAEPLPSRLASIALGTGDIDCTYHVALPELRGVLADDVAAEDARELFEIMIQGKRLRDITDLPLDLVA